MDLSSILNIYGEFGLLVLCGIVIIYLFIQNYKRRDEQDNYKNKRIEHKDETVENKFNALVDLLQKQNLEYQEQQQKNTELLIQNIINGVTNHVPSKDDNSRLTQVTEEINNVLNELLKETGADRVNLVQYHNGGHGINKQAFLKMSMTNEQVKFGVKAFIQESKDQFRSMLAFFVKALNDLGECYISDIEDLKNIDNSMYDYMKNKGIESKFGIAIRDHEGTVIAFVSAEFINKQLIDLNKIDRALKDSRKIFETLLSL